MLFSRNWLAEYVELPGDLREIAERLTGVGLAVEGVEARDDDAQLDIDVTTNRPDCMNHLGVARELSVIYGRSLKTPPVAPQEGTERVERVEDTAAVEVEDWDGCPRYVARVVRGVKVGPSPDWLRARLESIGQRSINNVVDVTNFLLWEMGQPLHAFDLAKLEGRRIVVRRARPGERLVTLDGAERKLDPEMLVIADAVRPVALAGVMGGADSEVTDATTDVLIESAHFDRKRVRVATRGLGMHTDASHRFERGVDPEGCLDAASRAARLISEIAGGTVLAGAIDRRRAVLPVALKGRLDLARLDAFAGAAVPPADAERWLTGLGFGVDRNGRNGGNVWDVTVPSWRLFDFQPRPDGTVYEADLFEEVLRHFGFDNIPAALPGLPGSDAPKTQRQILREKVRDRLAASGYTEAVNFAFQSPEMDAAFPTSRPGTKPLRLANPLSDRYSVMRRSLVPNLVEAARFNRRRGLSAVRLFEIATVFCEDPSSEVPDQPEHVALVCGGRLGSPWQREVELDLFDLKGVVESLAEAVRLEVRPAALTGLLAGSAAELLRSGQPVGWFGRVAQEEGFPLYVAEVALAALAPLDNGDVSLKIETPSRFPGIDADFTLTHSLDTPWAEIDQAIAAHRPADLVSWEMTVRYRGQGVPEGAVNTTIHFLYNSPERSLTQEEVNERQLALNAELERRFGWKG
jgi:phenylalanyl-tRNA synthetase beta chain